jgi:hypothetical protein
MLISKSQVQSFDHAGIYLLEAIFGHVHLNVALTGGRNHWNVKVILELCTKKEKFCQMIRHL